MLRILLVIIIIITIVIFLFLFLSLLLHPGLATSCKICFSIWFIVDLFTRYLHVMHSLTPDFSAIAFRCVCRGEARRGTCGLEGGAKTGNLISSLHIDDYCEILTTVFVWWSIMIMINSIWMIFYLVFYIFFDGVPACLPLTLYRSFLAFHSKCLHTDKTAGGRNCNRCQRPAQHWDP